MTTTDTPTITYEVTINNKPTALAEATAKLDALGGLAKVANDYVFRLAGEPSPNHAGIEWRRAAGTGVGIAVTTTEGEVRFFWDV